MKISKHIAHPLHDRFKEVLTGKVLFNVRSGVLYPIVDVMWIFRELSYEQFAGGSSTKTEK